MKDFLKWFEGILDVPSGTLNEDTTKDEIESWDSLMQMRIAMEADEKYNAKIPMNEIGEIDSVRKLWSYIKL